VQVTTKDSGQTITIIRISGSAKEAVKNGYAYVFVSNESNNLVYFDNLQISHERGPITEETHYYPFGLTMAGISSKALNFGNPENKKNKFQNQEFGDDFGINYYEFKYRNHDPQIGRFIQIDPLSEDYVYNSTYAFSENKVTTHVELEGLEAVLFSEKANILKGNVGHTFVAVGSGESTTVYTYGRYAELGKQKGSLNPTNMSGEGVLIKLQGTDATNFIDKYVNDNGATAYEFKSADENKVKDYFEDKFTSSEKVPEVGTFAGDERARVIDQYNLANNNCTTISCEGIKAGLNSDVLYTKETKHPKSISGKIEVRLVTTPTGIINDLEKASKDVRNNITDVTEKYKKSQ
jgi:RHS repeat-associated protein